MSGHYDRYGLHPIQPFYSGFGQSLHCFIFFGPIGIDFEHKAYGAALDAQGAHDTCGDDI